tara:strand:- start:7626 stop:7904 length:279 start_codon:yes stop_codon:yes gene_type:complete
MATIKELNNVFDQVEELVGTSPSADGLRNAIHAILTPSFKIPRTGGFHIWRKVASPAILNNVEYLARNYETLRQIHVHLGASCQVTCDTPTK